MLNVAPRYFSTNAAVFGTPDLEERVAKGQLQTVDLAEAIIAGQAPDGGLYMPTHFPQISLEAISRMRDMSYAQVFVEVIKDFFQDVLSESTLERIAHDAYEGDSPFEPLVEPLSDIDHIGRLDEGPTFAFKDYAAQVLFRFMEALMEERPKTPMIIVTAASDIPTYLGDIDLMTIIASSSGDTGSAVGTAILNRKKMWMPILHPADLRKKSDLQAKQMDTLEGNTYAIWARTDFDGCQRIARQLLGDQELQYMNMNSANSINIGRLLPQIAYYFYIYSRAAKNPGENVCFSVPSGNFGDAVAGLFAIRMGLPAKLIIAVNENDVFERFYRACIYAPAEKTINTPSNAMDVNWPSNMRRLFQLYGGQLVEGKDPDDPERTVIERFVLPNLHQMRQEIAGAYRVSNEETLKAIEEFWEAGYFINKTLHSTLEPHGAVAWAAAQRFRKKGYNGTIVSFETAHPGKFPEYLVNMGIKPQLPRALYRLADSDHGRHFEVDADYNTIKQLIMRFYNQELARQK